MQINGLVGYKTDVTWNQIISIDIKTLWSSAHFFSFWVRSNSSTPSSITLCVNRQLAALRPRRWDVCFLT